MAAECVENVHYLVPERAQRMPRTEAVREGQLFILGWAQRGGKGK